MKKVPRTEYQIEVRLKKVVDLRGNSFEVVGVTQMEFEGLDYTLTQAVGGAVVALGSDGLIVPSARSTGTNLVIYPQNAGRAYVYKVIAETSIEL